MNPLRSVACIGTIGLLSSVLFVACARSRPRQVGPSEPAGGTASAGKQGAGPQSQGGTAASAGVPAAAGSRAGTMGPPPPKVPRTSAEVPEPPDGITVDDGAELPEGVWVGAYRRVAIAGMEGFSFVCGTHSTRVTLQVRSGSSTERPVGTIVFGDHQQLEPPQEPEPPMGYESDLPDGFAEAACGGGGQLRATYPYSLRTARISQQDVFDFTLVSSEPWDSWCSQQMSYARKALATRYSCLPPMSSATYDACQASKLVDHEGCPMSFAAFTLCREGGACLCFEDGCRANVAQTLAFKLQRTGDELAGVVSQGPEFPQMELRLRRVQ